MTAKSLPYRHIFTLGLLLFATAILHAKADTTELAHFETFHSTRIINGHAVEVLQKKNFDFRITHRFGDIGGDNGNVHTLYGLDNSTDIRIGFEYGLTADLMLGVARNKGAGPLREIWEGFLKYNFTRQSQQQPFTVSLLTSGTITSMKPTADETSPASFNNAAQRMSYCGQILVGRKVSDRFSVQLSVALSHRNYVAFFDENQIWALGAAGRFRITKVVGLSAEYFYLSERERSLLGNSFYDPLSLGIEINTGGHVFQIDVTNSAGIGENQFIPYTLSSWEDGGFRFGFTISRPIQL